MSAYELTKTILKDSANLKAYYRFESGNLTVDSSGNSHTLTAIGTPTEDASGKYGGAVALATNQAYSTTDGADFKPTGDFSAGGWIKTSSSAASEEVFVQSYSVNTLIAGFYIAKHTDHTIITTLGRNLNNNINDGYIQFATTTAINDGAWHHVVLTHNSTITRLYVDGKMAGSVAWATNAAYAATNYVRVGCKNTAGTNTNFWNGSLDDIFLLNGTALSADQIKELYEGRYIGEWWPQSNLVGLWHLNGNSTDTSGNNNHGTDTAITYSQANGKFIQGAGFNGSTSKVVVTDSSSLKPTGNFTVNFWMKILNNSGLQQLVQSYSQNGNVAGFYIDLESNGTLALLSGKNSGTTANVDYKAVLSSAVVDDGSWKMITGVYDGSNLKIYVNGSQDVTDTWANNPAYAATNYVRIGCKNTTGTDGSFYAGAIDEVAIFSRALTAAEIRHWYAWSVGKYI